jgi:glutamine amidotransferase
VITVIDYGMGNLRNVRRAFEEIGQEVHVTADKRDVASAGHLILPGVGAFGEAISRIDQLGLREAILDHVKSSKPLLGICLGMQLLFEESEESPGVKGLGVFDGAVRKFGTYVKVPHIGWNDIAPAPDCTLFTGIPAGTCFYFVHSYYAELSSLTTASAEYGMRFSAAVGKGSIHGVQFHPEKSQEAGATLLSNFLKANE